MSAAIVDASVALKWFVEEEGSSDAADLIAGGTARLAPDLVIPEVLNAAWKAFSRGFMVREQYDAIPRLLPDLFQDIVPTKRLASRAATLAREMGHPAYDCFYLALAEEQNLPLITADRRLVNRVVDTKFERLVVKLIRQAG
ncbi:type II toxin-antitoxin system VapC family toxin [Skermanella rosea]|uniref:type II toxin-antitoxin system VapC family toxin n=1 Tax=Skermanella rosea TaxID=1817965 RepID=UPI001931BAAF|nr:type II toxin-antitoxin system VapC family toxin [Skermanella rosea]UEM04761.1 type II toxin-antitoxin system VapC family toxin [Skermanella rosea]